MDKDLEAQEKELTDDINSLTKKVPDPSCYLEAVLLTHSTRFTEQIPGETVQRCTSSAA